MKIIALGARGQYETMVSNEDYDFLMQWRWNYKISAHKNCRLVYARRGGGRNRGSGENQPTILMHHVILERQGLIRPDNMTCDHRDQNSLNNQRYNLRWATHSEQGLNRRYLRSQSNELDSIPF